MRTFIPCLAVMAALLVTIAESCTLDGQPHAFDVYAIESTRGLAQPVLSTFYDGVWGRALEDNTDKPCWIWQVPPSPEWGSPDNHPTSLIKGPGTAIEGTVSLPSGDSYSSMGTTTPPAQIDPSVPPQVHGGRITTALPAPPKVVGGFGGWSPQRVQTAPSEPLSYRFRFPEECSSRVRAEMLRADREFVEEEQLRMLTFKERRALAIRWICRSLAVFAQEACDLARKDAPDWRPSQIEPRITGVMRQLVGA